MVEDLRALLSKNNLTVPIEWNTDKPIREGSQWFIGKKWSFNGKEFYQAWFGDYKKDLKLSWKPNEMTFTPEEREQAKAQAESVLAAEREAREKVHEELALELADEWDEFAISGTTPYLHRKQITNLFGCRIKANENGDPILIVPMRDVDGKFWNYQRIYAQKLSKGDKFFQEGAKIDGCFHVLRHDGRSELLVSDDIYIAEGFATSASIALALGPTKTTSVVCSFNAQNLIHVAVAIREKYPLARITLCADNDAYTVIKGKAYNVGLEKGRRAAGQIKANIRWPIFKYPQKGLTDFNDLHCAEGLDTVRDEIEHPEKYVKGIQPMCLPATKSGKPIVPTEKEVTDYLLAHFDGKLMKQEKDLFRYTGTHWEELNVAGIDSLKQMIAVAANGLLGSRDISAYYNYLLIHLPHVPRGVDFFQPNPCAANFLNGTLHYWTEHDGKNHLEFRKHDATDYLTSCLPFNCPDWQPGKALPPAPLFDGMLERLWSTNHDKEQIKLLAHELVGAVLMPAFPVITFFYGRPQSGKSTLIKLLVKMVARENVSSVQLCDLHGFNMETMVAKLVNFDTDIDLVKPMNDSEVKKIIDRMPRRVRRKGRQDVYAYLPAVHLFAGNNLPKSLDGSSQAYGHRILAIKTESFKPDKKTTDFEQKVLDNEIEAIVARGIEGLYRLIENGGAYTQPESSAENVREIETNSDIVAQFLKDLEYGEVKDNNSILKKDPAATIPTTNLWDVFNNWQHESVTQREQIGKIQFFNALKVKGYDQHKTNKDRRFKGIGIVAQETGIA